MTAAPGSEAMSQPLRSLFDDALDEISSLRIRPDALRVHDDDAPTPIHVQVVGYGAFCVGCRFPLGLIPMGGWEDDMKNQGVPQHVIDFIAGELEPLQL
jgi:hypothetical protein